MNATRMRKKSGGLSGYAALALLLLSALTTHAQLRIRHDSSGNLTNVLLGAAAPTINVLDATQTLMTGDLLSLSAVVINGSSSISYQWRLNGVDIAGATNATFFDANTVASDAGTYSVVVSNSAGVVTNIIGDITILASTNSLQGIAYAFNQYVAVGENGIIVASTNLVAWFVRNSGTTNRLDGIAFGNNMLVAVGAKGTVLTSSNGVDWVVRSSGNTNDLHGVAYGTNTFVAAGSGGTTMTSSNGINWVTQSFDYPRLEAITYANGFFVAVGTGGTIWRSAQGIGWGNYTWPTSSSLNAVGFGNGKFFAAGADGLLLSSTNAVNWSVQTTGTEQTFDSILLFNSTLFALGPVGSNFISADGSAWSASPSRTFEPLYASTVGNGVAVAVGRNGTILQIPSAVFDHYEFSAIASPQRVNQSFSATITAKDAANNAIPSFAGPVNLSGLLLQSASTNTILGSISPSAFNTGPYTAGYTFTPNTDLIVTQVRHFAGNQVYIWRDNGGADLLLGIAVTNASSNWVSTPLPVPLTLKAGESYLLAAFSATNMYFRTDVAPTFAHGTIDQAFFDSNASPTTPRGPVSYRWPLVDLTYVAQNQQAVSISPTSATLANGTATVNVTVAGAGESVMLKANDAAGKSGLSSPFSVLQTNDLSVTLAASPNPVTVLSNLTYTISVMNSGPNSSTSVNVTNSLPAGVNFVSASSSQGTPQYTNGKVTCNLGTLASLTKATMTLTVTPTNASVMLTNTVTVARSEAESILTNNTATITTYVPPTIFLYDWVMTEGNTGTTDARFDVQLSSPSTLAVKFDAQTIDGTAIAGSDYVPVNGRFTFSPGATFTQIYVPVQNDTLTESNEYFFLLLSNPTNGTFSRSAGICWITNNDGLAGQVSSFAWNPIASPQRTNQPFQATITAKDAANNTATTFTNAAILRGINIGGTSSKTILTSDGHTASDNLWLYTLGYEFTPSTNLFVTHFRQYFGTKVSLWTSTGFLLASNTVDAVSGEWSETELAKPVYLKAGDRYRIGVYSGGNPYFWRTDLEPTFINGSINQSYYGVGDDFPEHPDGARWYMVDLRYSLPAAISPTNTGNFTNGVWSGNLSIQDLGTNFVLLADDGDGHSGFSGRIGVYPTNDLAITMTYSPTAPLVGSNLVYSIVVLNAGPNSVSNIFVTNTLPVDAEFVSAVGSQGTCTQTNGVVTCDLGTLGNLAAATNTITVRPLVAGSLLTNNAIVVRAGTDANPANNEATVVLVPNLALSLQLRDAGDYYAATWRSGGGSDLWFSQTNVTHDGIDALQSGPIIHGQVSWASMALWGPGTLSFWWKVSSEANADFLYFYSNTVPLTAISGNVGWEQKTYSLPAGATVVSWLYAKDADISAGSDAAWLDQVKYTVPSFYFSSSVWTNGVLKVTVNGTTGQRLTFQQSSNLLQWTPLSNGTVTLPSASSAWSITPPTTAPYLFFRLMHFTQ